MWTLEDKYGAVSPQQRARTVAQHLLKELEVYDPFIFYVSRDRKSWYIHFRALPNKLTHKLRISNHEERARYGYKWQMRLDKEHVNEKPMRFYFWNTDYLVKAFKRYYDKVEGLNAEIMAYCERPAEEESTWLQ